jgi:hypothetical protein
MAYGRDSDGGKKDFLGGRSAKPVAPAPAQAQGGATFVSGRGVGRDRDGSLASIMTDEAPEPFSGNDKGRNTLGQGKTPKKKATAPVPIIPTERVTEFSSASPLTPTVKQVPIVRT